MNNQELEFRVWDVRLNLFLPTNNTDGKFNPLWFQNENKNGERYVIQQYIGLKDKTGKKIFAGDIVVHDSISYSHYFGEDIITNFEIIPVLHINSLVYCLKRFGESPILNLWTGEEVEILGNIFENKELLK